MAPCTTSTATVTALGRLHGDATGTPARQRSSSVTIKGTRASLSPHLPSPKWVPLGNHAANKGLNQKEKVIALSDLSALLSESNSTSNRVADRINLVPSPTDHTLNNNNHNNNNNNHSNNQSNGNGINQQIWMQPSSPQDHNGDMFGDQAQGSTPTICTGRSRSSTLTTTSTGAVDIAAAVISSQLDHVMRPRRPSLASRPSAPNICSVPALPVVASPTATPSHTLYPPEPTLPQYHLVEETKEKTLSAPSWTNIQLGFLPRIILLIGIFCASLSGLYLLAQVLPPLSLPKSIDDVKIDAAILQEFATATYEGWIRTFWVFSVVYMWKQCFGIPGSAFLNILAGALYGPWFGTVLTSLLTTFGSVLAYFMSFFLMEPILNRYASSRLDQMRLQVQKKTMGSKKKRRNSATTFTNIQPSTNASTTEFPGITTHNSHSESTSSQGTHLRPRAGSIALRRIDNTDQNISSHYPYPNFTMKNNEIESQENDRLYVEDQDNENPALPISQQNDVTSGLEIDDEGDDESEGTSLFMQLLLIRLFPLTPYWFINLASPLVGVPVIPFMTSMFLGCMPYNYICAQAGAILSEIHELRDIYRQPWILFQVIVVLILSTAAVFVSKRAKKKQVESEEGKNGSSESETVGDEATHHLLRSNFEDDEQYNSQQYRFEGDQGNIPMSSLDSQHTAHSGSNRRESAIIDIPAYR